MSTPAETPRPLIALVDAVDKALHPDAIRTELRALFGDDDADRATVDLNELVSAAILDSVVKRVTPLLAPVSSSEDTPARVWQEGDEIPADVRIVYGKRDSHFRQEAPQGRGPDGWWNPSTGVISEHRLLAEHGPVSEVPAGGEPA